MFQDPLKTLEDKATNDAKGEPKKEENEESQVKQPKVDASKSCEDKEVGSKRKHDEATGEESETTDKKDEGDEEAEGSSDNEEAEDAEVAKRARKKSKTTADEAEPTADE